jgi:hypothetical protein
MNCHGLPRPTREQAASSFNFILGAIESAPALRGLIVGSTPDTLSLATGVDILSLAFGVIAEQATGYPGYDAIIGLRLKCPLQRPAPRRSRC